MSEQSINKKNIVSITGMLPRTRIEQPFVIEWFDCVDGQYRRVLWPFASYNKARQMLLFLKGKAHTYPCADFDIKTILIDKTKQR